MEQTKGRQNFHSVFFFTNLVLWKQNLCRIPFCQLLEAQTSHDVNSRWSPLLELCTLFMLCLQHPLPQSPHMLGPSSQRLIMYEQQGEKSLGLYETIHFTHTSAGSGHRKSLTDTPLILSMLRQQNTDCLWLATGHVFGLSLNHPSALSATHSHTHVTLVQFQ